MKVKIEINLDNDAFKESPVELERLLEFINLSLSEREIDGIVDSDGSFIGITDCVSPRDFPASLLSVNGNTVGQLEVVEND
jgi:hypothetical protein